MDLIKELYDSTMLMRRAQRRYRDLRDPRNQRNNMLLLNTMKSAEARVDSVLNKIYVKMEEVK